MLKLPGTGRAGLDGFRCHVVRAGSTGLIIGGATSVISAGSCRLSHLRRTILEAQIPLTTWFLPVFLLVGQARQDFLTSSEASSRCEYERMVASNKIMAGNERT